MKRLWVFTALLVGCMELSRAEDLEIERQKALAQQALKQVELSKARALYANITKVRQDDAHAALGHVLTDLLLIAESAPAERLIETLCHQQRFDIAKSIFGESGVLAREDLADEGEAQIVLSYQASLGGSSIPIDFVATGVRSQLFQSDVDGVSTRYLELELREAGAPGDVFLSLVFNVDDVISGDSVVTPLTEGLDASLGELDVRVDVLHQQSDGPVLTFQSNVPLSGRIRFQRLSLEVGAPVEVSLSDVRIPAECGDGACTAFYALSGMVKDRITEVADFKDEELPFGTIHDQEGPPLVPQLVGMVEACDPLTDDVFASVAKELGTLLYSFAGRLTVFEDEGLERFQYTLPPELLFTERSIPLNLTDALVLKGGLELAAALLELAAQYTYFEGELLDMVEVHDVWEANGQLRRYLDFLPRLVVQNLNANLLNRTADFDSAEAVLRLRRALSSLELALTVEPEQEGLLDLQHPQAVKLSQSYAGLMEALRLSLEGQGPQAPAAARPLVLDASAFFEPPLDRARLLEVTMRSGLLELQEGEPEAVDPLMRNSSVPVDGLLEALGPVFELGIDGGPHDGAVCEEMACPSGYVCEGDRCSPEVPWMFSERAFRSVSSGDDGWPVVVNPVVQNILNF